MDSFKVEYFMTVDGKDPFCCDKSSFDNFLQSFDGISVQENRIYYKSLEIDYELEIDNIAVDRQRYFHIILSIREESCIGKFEKFLKVFRTALFKVSREQPKLLWDDIGFYYAHQAYPLIHEIENIMRKLITKFMLTSVGLSWFETSTPKEVSRSIRTRESRDSKKDLYEADFIQLANFLFKKYTPDGSPNIDAKVDKAATLEDLNLEDLKSLLPQSNWERYFASIVNCESGYLESKWKKLYRRRNQIAHNQSMNKAEFNEIQKLVKEINPILQEAISKLDKVTVSAEQRESIAENATENLAESRNIAASILSALPTDMLSDLVSELANTDLDIGKRWASVRMFLGGNNDSD